MRKTQYQTGDGFKIRAETKLKNSVLISAREKLGLSIKEAAEKIGINYASLCYYENMRGYPSEESQNKICRFYKKRGIFMYEPDVFPEELKIAKFKRKYVAEGKIPTHELLPLSEIDERLLPATSSIETELENSGLREDIESCLSELTPREETVLRGIYFEGKTENELKKEFSVCGARIGQIKNKALRRLRLPKRADKLKSYLR